jgi:hypothetical protein
MSLTMKTKFRLLSLRSPTLAGSPVILVLLALVPLSLPAQSTKKNPTSKLYVSDVSGEAQIDTNDNVQDLMKRSVYTAEGTIVETKKAATEADQGKTFSTAVYSNGTAAYFDEDTRVEIKAFQQEPFTPNRADADVEPSISKTQAHVSRGTVGLCASKLVAGSSMNYSTALGSVNIRGQKVVIEAHDNETKISMLDGESTVRGGSQDMGGQVLKAGQQAIIRHGGAGQPNIVQVQTIPQAELAVLDDKVAMACMAKKTVYFEVKERTVTESAAPATPEAAASGSVASADTASGSSTDSSGSALVTAFNGPVANSSPSIRTTIVQEIIAVPVVPSNLPVQFTVSPARIVTPKPPGG